MPALNTTGNQKNEVEVSKPISAPKQNYRDNDINDENAAPETLNATMRTAAPAAIEEKFVFFENLSDRIKKRENRRCRQIDEPPVQCQPPATKKAKVQAPKVAKVAEKDNKKAVVQNRRDKPAVKKAIKKQKVLVAKYRRMLKCTYSKDIKKEARTEHELCNCLAQNQKCSDFSCLNRASNIECPPTCPVENCENQRFAKRQYAEVEEFHAGERGFGVKALKKIKKGEFIMEYVGRVLGTESFEMRKNDYEKMNNHYFFDNGKYTIDANRCGNSSRLINHCCEPNSRSQKWLVPGTPQDIPHVGLFADQDIEPGEEITFDYQFEVYGLAAQPCYCGKASCKGTIGCVKPTKNK